MKKENIENEEIKATAEASEPTVEAAESAAATENNEDNAAEDNQDNAPENAEPERDPLEVAQEEIQKLKETVLYKVAEFDNYRKRVMKEKAEIILNGSSRAVEAVLPVIDDMELAIKNAGSTDDPAVLKEGMELIYQKFIKALEGLGVKKIETSEADFNTDYHEAIAMVPGMGDDKKNKVIDCIQTGYTINDKVIRHAKVAVGA